MSKDIPEDRRTISDFDIPLTKADSWRWHASHDELYKLKQVEN